jgi:hypothetical protein
MTARHHHYLSQCYLKGFTNGGSKKSKLTVIDLREKKQFETTPRNVGGLRDFNRIDLEGLDQNILEKSLSEFEGAAATALRKIEEGANFDGDIKDSILYLIALLATRSPERREHWRQFEAQVMERIMDASLATKEMWESQLRHMKESGKEIDESIKYEDVKEFFKKKQYTIEFAREHHIRMEFVGVNAILPLLYKRKWLIVKSTNESGPLITSDNPVNLTWNEPERIPPFYRASPGYGMKDTQVYIPLSKNTGLIGEFDGHEGTIDGTQDLVAILNSKTLMFTFRQLYAPKLGFYFHDHNGHLLDGKKLLKFINI